MREDEQIRERYDLTIERIRTIPFEESVASVYRDYFQKTAEFILELDAILNRVSSRPTESCTQEELREENRNIYQDILGDNYERSYANPSFSVSVMGEEIGQYLSSIYAEIRKGVVAAYEGRMDYLTIRNELFVEIYNYFENESEPNYRELRNALYWYVSDYYEVFLTDRIKKQGLREANGLFLHDGPFIQGDYGTAVSEKFEADHMADIGLVWDKKMMERKLEVIKNTLEQMKQASMNYDGDIGFSEEKCVGLEPSPHAIKFSEKQLSLNAVYREKEKQIISQYL